MDFLRVKDISKQTGSNTVLRDIGFVQQPFQKLALAGENGSGKTTLLRIIAGLQSPTTGEVYFEEQRVKGPDEKLIPGHPGIAYLSQHFELRNNYRVEEELSYTNQLREDVAGKIFEVCRISHLLKRKTDQLSGGERQRISLARVLISSPRLLLLDEPFSNLDTAHRTILKSVIRDLSEELKITLLLIMHDPFDLLSWSDEIMVMKEGGIIQKANPPTIYKKPVNEYTAGLFGSYNLVPKEHQPLFSPLPGFHPGTKDFLFRPEDIIITSDRQSSLKGIVSAIIYFGPYYETIVTVNGFKLIVRTTGLHHSLHEEIYLTLSPDAVCYLSH